MAVLGLDIGGSKTQAALAENGTVIAEALAGSANVTSVGPDAAGEQLDLVLARLGEANITTVCAGAAGGDTPPREAPPPAPLARRVAGAPTPGGPDSPIILASPRGMGGNAPV